MEGDKSLSIRWVLFSAIANGVSTSQNLLNSEDVMAAINMIKKLGINVKISKTQFKIYGKGINGFKFKPGINLNAENSGTAGRLILGLLINSPYKIKLVGDKSLSKRDFKRITDPLSKFGASFRLTKGKTLPLTIKGTDNLKPINYFEKKVPHNVKVVLFLLVLKLMD